MKCSCVSSIDRRRLLSLLLILHSLFDTVVIAASFADVAILPFAASFVPRISTAAFPVRSGQIFSFMKMSTSTSTDNMNNGGVVVVGSANQDMTSYTPHIPTMGETVMGTSFETSCGGKGANQAVAAACLGINAVQMVCRVGQDSFGANLLSNFRTYAQDITISILNGCSLTHNGFPAF